MKQIKPRGVHHTLREIMEIVDAARARGAVSIKLDGFEATFEPLAPKGAAAQNPQHRPAQGVQKARGGKPRPGAGEQATHCTCGAELPLNRWGKPLPNCRECWLRKKEEEEEERRS